MDRQFIIIGAGMGQISGLTYQAKETILGAAQVFAAPRIAKSLEMLRQITPATIPEIPDFSALQSHYVSNWRAMARLQFYLDLAACNIYAQNVDKVMTMPIF